MKKKIISYIINPFKIFHVLSYKVSYFLDNRRLIAFDTAHNKRVSTNKPFILILREHGFRYNQHFLDWIDKKYPQISGKIWLGRLPGQLPPLNNATLLIPWFQDPLRERNARLFALARNIEDKFIQQNRAVINPVSCLSLAIKSSALKLLHEGGLRTAKVMPVNDPSEFLSDNAGIKYPFIIRCDIQHGSETYLIRNPAELDCVHWRNIASPIAMEFIDVVSPDEYYRKYRMMVIGDTCLPRHLLISKNWNTHLKERITEDWALKEEQQFVEGSHPKASQLLIKARRVLGLDVVTFDFGIDRLGEIVIWEPNPFPTYWFTRNESYYSQNDKDAIEKIYETLLQYYLKRSGIPDAASLLPPL